MYWWKDWEEWPIFEPLWLSELANRLHVHCSGKHTVVSTCVEYMYCSILPRSPPARQHNLFPDFPHVPLKYQGCIFQLTTLGEDGFLKLFLTWQRSRAHWVVVDQLWKSLLFSLCLHNKTVKVCHLGSKLYTPGDTASIQGRWRTAPVTLLG